MEQDEADLQSDPVEAMLEPSSTSSSDEDYIYDVQSVTSSVLEYEYENGRRYHGWMAGSYPLPNDEAEMERMDLKHHVMRLLCDGRLHIAPLSNPRRILDLGTGSGIWAIEMGEKFPDATISGVDLSVIQPELYVTGTVLTSARLIFSQGFQATSILRLWM